MRKTFQIYLTFLMVLTPALCVSPAQEAVQAAPNNVTAPHLSAEDAAASARDTAPSFTLALKAGLRNKSITEFRAGSTVWITIIQTNTTRHAIDTSGAFAGPVNQAFSYEALDESGRPAEKVVRRHPELDTRSPYWSAIPAGGSDLSEVQINKLFKFDRPGKYVIRVSRRELFVKDQEGKPAVIWSNPITITITG